MSTLKRGKKKKTEKKKTAEYVKIEYNTLWTKVSSSFLLWINAKRKPSVLKKKQKSLFSNLIYDCILSNYINVFNYKVGFNGNNRSQTIWVI